MRDRGLVEPFTRACAGEGGVGDQAERVGPVAGGGGQGGEAGAFGGHAAGGVSGPSAPKSTETISPLRSVNCRPGGRTADRQRGRLGLRRVVAARGRFAGGAPGVVGVFALADAVVGFAVGEDRAEVAQHGLGVHALPVAVAQPGLGGGGEQQQVALALAADALDLAGGGADREHDGGERGVEVGADAGGDGGAFAGVGVERLQPGE